MATTATLAVIRDYVRQITLVESTDFSDSILDTIINQGIREIGSLHPWPYLQAEDTITLVDDQETYALPTDFNRLEVVMGDSGEELIQTTRRKAQRKYLGSDGGTPQVYYLWQEKLAFAPTPSGSTFSTVIIDYLREPTELDVDGDVPEFYSAFHYLPAIFAASKVWEREEDFERADYYYRHFRGGVLAMVEHYTNRTNDDPLVVGGGDTSKRLDPQRPFMTWLQPFPS